MATEFPRIAFCLKTPIAGETCKWEGTGSAQLAPTSLGRSETLSGGGPLLRARAQPRCEASHAARRPGGAVLFWAGLRVPRNARDAERRVEREGCAGRSGTRRVGRWRGDAGAMRRGGAEPLQRAVRRQSGGPRRRAAGCLRGWAVCVEGYPATAAEWAVAGGVGGATRTRWGRVTCRTACRRGCRFRGGGFWAGACV